MLELSLTVFGVSAFAAFLGGKVGYRMGAKRVAAAITDLKAPRFQTLPQQLRPRLLIDHNHDWQISVWPQ